MLIRVTIAAPGQPAFQEKVANISCKPPQTTPNRRMYWPACWEMSFAAAMKPSMLGAASRESATARPQPSRNQTFALTWISPQVAAKSGSRSRPAPCESADQVPRDAPCRLHVATPKSFPSVPQREEVQTSRHRLQSRVLSAVGGSRLSIARDRRWDRRASDPGRRASSR